MLQFFSVVKSLKRTCTLTLSTRMYVVTLRPPTGAGNVLSRAEGENEGLGITVYMKGSINYNAAVIFKGTGGIILVIQ